MRPFYSGTPNYRWLMSPNESTATTLIDPILARVKMVPWVAPGRFRDTSAEGST
jgi:hypothetical protein